MARTCTGEDSPFHPFPPVCDVAVPRALSGLTPFPRGSVRASHRSGRGVSLLFQSQPSPTPGVCPVARPAGGGTFLMPAARESGSLCPSARTPAGKINGSVRSHPAPPDGAEIRPARVLTDRETARASMILACGIVRMADTADRHADKTPRRTHERRWEVFVPESESDLMRRAGTVAAPSPDVAHEEATGLFGWHARDVWLCPADETHRFSTYSLGDAVLPPRERDFAGVVRVVGAGGLTARSVPAAFTTPPLRRPPRPVGVPRRTRLRCTGS